MLLRLYSDHASQGIYLLAVFHLPLNAAHVLLLEIFELVGIGGEHLALTLELSLVVCPLSLHMLQLIAHLQCLLLLLRRLLHGPLRLNLLTVKRFP